YARSHHGSDDPGAGIDMADAEAVLLTDVNVVAAVDEQRVRHDDGGFDRGPAVAAGGAGVLAVDAGRKRVAEHRRQDATPVDPADSVVTVVVDVELVARVEGKVLRVVQRRLERRDAVAVVAAYPDAREARDDANPRIDPADRAGKLVGKIEVPRAISRDPARDVGFSGGRGATVGASTATAAPGERGDYAGR